MSDLTRLSDDELCSRWRASNRHRDVGEWLAVFRRRRIGRRPTGPVTAYRGAKTANGMSWTDTKPAAKMYARANRSPVWSAQLRPSAIVAVIEHSGYSEYVVDPDKLGTIRQISEAPPRRQTADRQPREPGRTIFAARMAEKRAERHSSAKQRRSGRNYR